MNLAARIARRIGWTYVDRGAVVRGHVALARGVQVAHHAELLAEKPTEAIRVGEGSQIHNGALLHCYGGRITLGRHVGVNPYCVLYGHGGLEIGDNVLIAAGCVLIPANHNFHRDDLPIRSQGLTCRGIHIEDDVWLGARVVVLDGVRIGRGAVIGAGAVVAKSIPAGAVAVGVPARVVRYRDLAPACPAEEVSV